MSKSDEDEERQNVLGESGLRGTQFSMKGVFYADGLDSTCVMRRAFCMKEILLERTQCTLVEVKGHRLIIFRQVYFFFTLLSDNLHGYSTRQ